VLVHDVAPQRAASIAVLLDALRPLVGRALAGAVVPRWGGMPLPAGAAVWDRLAQDAFGELLLHGLTHTRLGGCSPVALLTGGANELSGLTPAQAVDRLRQGQADMAARFGATARGFVAPAWQPGPVTPRLLPFCGLVYSVGLRSLRVPGLPILPLAVWSWDCGRVAALGLLGEALGRARQAARGDAVPCVVLHPADVQRGFLPRALRTIERLLGAGRRPVLPGDIVAWLVGEGVGR
jgi:predicted deacetylase